MQRTLIAIAAVCCSLCLWAAPVRADTMDTAACEMPQSLYEDGSYQEALLISEDRMRETKPKNDLTYTICAEIAMASAAKLQKYEKCMAYAAIAEQGLAKHGADVDAVMQKITGTCADVEHAATLAPEVRAQYLETLRKYQGEVKAIYDQHKTKRSMKKLQYRVEYVLSAVLIVAALIFS